MDQKTNIDKDIVLGAIEAARKGEGDPGDSSSQSPTNFLKWSLSTI